MCFVILLLLSNHKIKNKSAYMCIIKKYTQNKVQHFFKSDTHSYTHKYSRVDYY